MAIELDHPFTTAKPIDESFAAITDLERVVPAVEGGSVTETISPEKVKAEILMRMGAMSMKLVGTKSGNATSISVSGDSFRSTLGLRSTWFSFS